MADRSREDDLEPEDNARSVRRVAATLLVAAAVLACFQSLALMSWVYDLPPSRLVDEASGLAYEWRLLMEELGFAGVTETVEAGVDALRALGW